MLSNELLLPCCECVINNNNLSWNSPISGNGLPGNELFSNFEVANFGNNPLNRNSHPREHFLKLEMFPDN